MLNAEAERAGRESEIVAQAGRAFAIPIATNMAGRGTDILLGVNPSFFAKKRVMQKLCPAVLTKQTGLPPKEQLAIVEKPACIPLPDLSAEALASIDKAVELTSAAVGKLPGMIEPGDQHHSASTEHWRKSARSLELGLRVMPAGHNALIFIEKL